MNRILIACFFLATSFTLYAQTNDYLSPDLRMHDLRGRVKMVVVNQWDTTRFDMNGMLILSSDDKVTRDDYNRIIRHELDYDADFSEYLTTKEYTYDADGYPLTTHISAYESGEEKKYVYDSNKSIYQVIFSKGSIGDYQIEGIRYYAIIETDERGNWTKRKVHTQVISALDVEHPHMAVPNFDREEIEVRQITYFN